MKLIAVVALLGLVGAVYGSNLNPEYIAKIVETAQQNDVVFDEDSVRPVEARAGRATWSCPGQASTGAPTSVHALKPVDVEVVMALGDSLTAANGAKAKSILGLLDECRGVSWAMGCEGPFESVLTFPTILKKFAPGLVGCSTGTGNVNSSVAYLNIAQPGDTSHETLGQARLLYSRISTTVPSFTSKWKVLNYFIGGNDLCNSCKDSKYSTANYIKNIQDTLDYVRTNFPRTLVNLVLTLDVTGINILTGTTCRNMQKTFCDCALATDLTTLNKLTKDYQAGVEALIASGRYDNDQQFTVVLHPFMKFMKPPTLANGNADYTYFSPDCFHFSQKGHEAAATELWNAMLTPIQLKTTQWTIGQAIKCPTAANPFIFTNQNSKNYVDTNKLKDLLMKN